MDQQLRTARHAYPVTTSDSADIGKSAHKGLFIGTGGALKVTTAAGETVTFPAVPVGAFPLDVTRVWATGTTASNIFALN